MNQKTRGSNRTPKGTKPVEKRQPRHHRAAQADAARFAKKTTGGAGKGSAQVEQVTTPPTRKKDGRWVVGIHSCREVFRVRPRAIAEIWLRNDWSRSEELKEFAQAAKSSSVQLQERTAPQLDALGHGHQGIALRVTENPQLDWQALESAEKAVVLVLDGLEDPQNLGSILRTAWLSGVSGILIPEDRAVGLTTSVCKIASGGAEHVAVERHTQFAQVFKRLKDMGFWIYGLAEKGKQTPFDLKMSNKVVWVVGAEDSGIRITTERICDELIHLPQVNSGSSYNASIATAMALAETIRQHANIL